MIKTVKQIGIILKFTLLELLIVIAVLVILMSLLLPALRSATNQVKQIQCMNNLKQQGTVFAMYAQDNNGWLPVDYDGTSIWIKKLLPYLGSQAKGNTGIFSCPGSPVHDVGRSYADAQTLANPTNLYKIDYPSRRYLVTDLTEKNNCNLITWSEPCTTSFNGVGWHHKKGANFLFADGHVQWYRFFPSSAACPFKWW